jgi:hypothetical protein
MIGLHEIHIEAYILYVLTEVSISPAAHAISPLLIHPHPSPGSYGSFLLISFTFLQYKITSDRGWHSSPRLPPCLFHEWAWKELLYQRCGQRTPPVGIQAISPVTQPTYHQPNLTSWVQGFQPSRSHCFLIGLRANILIVRAWGGRGIPQ